MRSGDVASPTSEQGSVYRAVAGGVNLVRNERIKLLATALNNLALAFAISGVVVPIIGGRPFGGLLTLVWFVLGAALHLCAQVVLGRLQE
jgi:hypothetical protein